MNTSTWKKRSRCEYCGQVKKKTAKRFCSAKCNGLSRPNKRTTENGYVEVWCPYHPNARGGYIFEHRKVMEMYLNRFLTKKEVVHHIDGNRSNNLIENLLLTNGSEHTTIEWAGKKHTEEAKHKMSVSRTGRIITPEWRKKISESHKHIQKLRNEKGRYIGYV